MNDIFVIKDRTGEHFSIIDVEDKDKVIKHKWNFVKGYFYSWDKIKNKHILLHRLIHGKKFPDHINRHKLDNRKSNFRDGQDKTLNSANKELQSNNTSGYKGVFWHKVAKKWMASIQVRGKQIYLGLFNDIIEAAKAYNVAATKYFGEYAKLNDV